MPIRSVHGSTTRLRRPSYGRCVEGGNIGSVPIGDILAATAEQVQHLRIDLEIAELVRAAQIHDAAAAVVPGIVLDQRIGAEVAEADTGFPPVGDREIPAEAAFSKALGI